MDCVAACGLGGAGPDRGGSQETWPEAPITTSPSTSCIFGTAAPRSNRRTSSGGPMGAYEADKYPFIAEECRLIEQLVGNGRPVLGVCLGAQVLAHALGARVYPGRGPELGFGFVELTELGEQDPVVGIAGSSLPVFHWHGDTFDLPIGAALLASSVPYPHQAFRFGNTAYGLQFHVESDPRTWLAWREHLPKGLLEEAELKQHLIEHVGRTVIGNFFDVARGAALLRTHSGNMRRLVNAHL